MALLFVDSFDDRTTVDALRSRYEQYDSSSIGQGAGRTGNALYLLQSNHSSYVRKNVPARKTLIVGCAMNLQGWVNGVPPQRLIGLLDGPNFQVYLDINADYTVTVSKGDGTTIGSSSAGQLLPIGSYVYIQLKVTIGVTDGVVVLRVNGVDWLSVSGIDTQATANALANRVQFGDQRATDAFQVIVDDVYICDDLNGSNDDFLGAVQIRCLLPSGAGAYTQWSPSTGTNWDCVNDATPDDDTTYVSTASIGALDSYAITDLPSAGNVLGVALNARARKDDVSSRQYQATIRHITTNSYLNASDLISTYRNDQWPLDANPVTSLAWTEADINGLEIGLRLAG